MQPHFKTNMARIQKTPTGEFSSYYGCYIIALAVFMVVGAIAWAAWSFYSQDKAIALIAADQPVKLPVPPLSPAAEQDLRARLTAFGAAAKSGAAATLDLTIAELNAIVQFAPDSGYGSYREMVRIAKTEPSTNTLIADLCMPMRKAKFWEGQHRYLIGEGVFLIEILEEGLDAKLVDVRIPGKTAPAGFVAGLQVWPWIAPYRKQEPLGSMLKGIKSATVTASGLRLATTK